MMNEISSETEESAYNVMRHKYRQLTHEESVAVRKIKDKGAEAWVLFDSIGTSRELSLAKTKAEEMVMWAVKHMTRVD